MTCPTPPDHGDVPLYEFEGCHGGQLYRDRSGRQRLIVSVPWAGHPIHPLTHQIHASSEVQGPRDAGSLVLVRSYAEATGWIERERAWLRDQRRTQGQGSLLQEEEG